jgi:hypothetical protein
MARLRPQKIWASLAMARSRPQKIWASYGCVFGGEKHIKRNCHCIVWDTKLPWRINDLAINDDVLHVTHA